jgi:hypothetical protein
VAVEQFCIDAGKSGNWKEGLRNILESETDRRHVIGEWNYLSGKGAHGGHDPTEMEAKHCLRITVSCLEFMSERMG